MPIPTIKLRINATSSQFWTSHAVSKRRRFLEADLAAVNRSHTPWLVVGGHRPFYIDSTNAAPGWGDLTVADDLQDALEDLFVRHQARPRGDVLDAPCANLIGGVGLHQSSQASPALVTPHRCGLLPLGPPRRV